MHEHTRVHVGRLLQAGHALTRGRQDMLPSCVAAVVVCPYSTPVRGNVNGPGTTAAANSQRQSLYAEQEARAAPNFHVSGRQARAMKSTVPVCAFTRPSSGLFAYQ